MTTDRRLETRLPSIIGEIARGPYPDYIDDVLAGTARKRQRPRWTFPERWLPMDIAAQPLPGVRRTPLLGLALLGLLLAALVGAVAISGGPKPRPAPPFGRAANGLVAYAMDGDIKAVDVATGEVKALVTGAESDSGPIFSPDGTHIVFARAAAGGKTDLMVARADGSGLVKLTPDALRDAESWGFSPDGRSVIAIALFGASTELVVVPSDGSGAPRMLDIGITSDDGAPMYRADGSEVVFVGRPAGAISRGVYAVDPRTGTVRTIVAGSDTLDVHRATLSPDGTRVAYGMFDPHSQENTARAHVIAVDGTGDVELGLGSDGAVVTWSELWSNDGTRLILFRGYEGSKARTTIIPVDQRGPEVELECPTGVPSSGDCSASLIWSPDDGTLLGTALDGTAYLADTATGRLRAGTWPGAGDPSWQRLAP